MGLIIIRVIYISILYRLFNIPQKSLPKIKASGSNYG